MFFFLDFELSLLNYMYFNILVTFLAAMYSSLTMFNIRRIIFPTINCNGNANVIFIPYSLNLSNNSLKKPI